MGTVVGSFCATWRMVNIRFFPELPTHRLLRVVKIPPLSPYRHITCQNASKRGPPLKTRHKMLRGADSMEPQERMIHSVDESTDFVCFVD